MVKMRVRDIAIIGMLGALLVAVQIGLSFLPNIELVSILIIVYTITLMKKTTYIISIFIILEVLIYGFGPWSINYLYVWFILYLISMIFRKEKSPLLWAILSGLYGLSFGALCAIPYFFIGSIGNTITNGFNMAFAYWINGIPFDILHGIANFFVTFTLFNPLYKILNLLTHKNYKTLDE
jgi:energy-coupling factor transport system substrate-specific component